MMAATTNLEKLIANYVQQIQELEQASFQLLNERGLLTSVGKQLDGLGDILKEGRNGRIDTEYLAALQGRILLILSEGTAEDVISVIRAFIPSPSRQVVLSEASFPAHFDATIPLAVDILPAEIVTGAAEPYSLSDGLDLTIEVDGGAGQLVTFNTASFADITEATAAEVAVVLNSGLTGATAIVSFNRVVIRSDVPGDPSSLEVTAGTANPFLVLPTVIATGPEANQALMFRVAKFMSSARSAGVKGTLYWSTASPPFGFLGTAGALGFGQGAFASASDGV